MATALLTCAGTEPSAAGADDDDRVIITDARYNALFNIVFRDDCKNCKGATTRWMQGVHVQLCTRRAQEFANLCSKTKTNVSGFVMHDQKALCDVYTKRSSPRQSPRPVACRM